MTGIEFETNLDQICNGVPSYLVVCLHGKPKCETGTSDTVGVRTFVEIPLRAPFVTRSPEWSIDIEYVYFYINRVIDKNLNKSIKTTR